MSKKKKGKVVSLQAKTTSPQNYIKTQARLLPVYECMVSRSWQESGLAYVLVARAHKTGNFTIGFYLVDLYCLGVKDTYYKFNMTAEEYDDAKDAYGDWAQCEYALAHNIVYGAIAYADDYGFKPHKDFAVTQFILHPDDEDTEMIEIEFGLNGMPYYVPGIDDNDYKIAKVTNTLLYTAGEGNFKVALNEDDWDDDDEDYFDDGEDDDDFSVDAEKQTEAFREVNLLYEALVQPASDVAQIDKPIIGGNYDLSDEPVKSGYNVFDDTEQEDLYFELQQLIADEEAEQAITTLQKTIKRYPHNAQFYNLLQTAYLVNAQFNESDGIILEMYRLFPDYLFAMVPYSAYLTNRGDYKGALAVFEGKNDLDDLYPDRKLFNIQEAAIYYATMCHCYAGLGDIDNADRYMTAILDNELYLVQGQFTVRVAMSVLAEAKLAKIKEVSGLSLSRDDDQQPS